MTNAFALYKIQRDETAVSATSADRKLFGFTERRVSGKGLNAKGRGDGVMKQDVGLYPILGCPICDCPLFDARGDARSVREASSEPETSLSRRLNVFLISFAARKTDSNSQYTVYATVIIQTSSFPLDKGRRHRSCSLPA